MAKANDSQCARDRFLNATNECSCMCVITIPVFVKSFFVLRQFPVMPEKMKIINVGISPGIKIP